jgi:hypothetical protein
VGVVEGYRSRIVIGTTVRVKRTAHRRPGDVGTRIGNTEAPRIRIATCGTIS